MLVELVPLMVELLGVPMEEVKAFPKVQSLGSKMVVLMASKKDSTKAFLLVILMATQLELLKELWMESCKTKKN